MKRLVAVLFVLQIASPAGAQEWVASVPDAHGAPLFVSEEVANQGGVLRTELFGSIQRRVLELSLESQLTTLPEETVRREKNGLAVARSSLAAACRTYSRVRAETRFVDPSIHDLMSSKYVASGVIERSTPGYYLGQAGTLLTVSRLEVVAGGLSSKSSDSLLVFLASGVVRANDGVFCMKMDGLDEAPDIGDTLAVFFWREPTLDRPVLDLTSDNFLFQKPGGQIEHSREFVPTAEIQGAMLTDVLSEFKGAEGSC